MQGPLNSKTIRCAESFADLNIDVLMIAWRDSSLKRIYSKKVKIDMIDDPKTLFTSDGVVGINLRRQIISNNFLLDKYSNAYDYIVRLRNDIILINKDFFIKHLNIATKEKKIWTININTTSPRLLSPFILKNHVSDWFFGGTPDKLREALQLDDIKEEKILPKAPRKFKNFIFWRNMQNEQGIWSKSWKNEFTNNENVILMEKPWEKSTIHCCLDYAKYLSRNFYISSFRKTGLQSTKYKCNLKTWYFSPYNLFILNSIEIFLINKGFLKILLIYPPILRAFFFCLRMNFIQKKKVRF